MSFERRAALIPVAPRMMLVVVTMFVATAAGCRGGGSGNIDGHDAAGLDAADVPAQPATDANDVASDNSPADVSVTDASAGDTIPEGPSSDGASNDTAVSDGAPGSDTSAVDAGLPPFRVLIFSRTLGFRHASIPTALATLKELQAMGGYVAEATEDPTLFTAANLARFQVVIFALTSGDVLNAAQQTIFESWIAGGGGYVGIHSASDTEYDWSFYGALVGAYFRVHPAIQTATVRVEAPAHPVMADLPVTWVRSDEWYDFVMNPRPNVTVLATLDESTYSGGTMGPDHPIIWAHPTSGGGRSFYTALGHTPESYSEPAFRSHLLNGIRWAARR